MNHFLLWIFPQGGAPPIKKICPAITEICAFKICLMFFIFFLLSFFFFFTFRKNATHALVDFLEMWKAVYDKGSTVQFLLRLDEEESCVIFKNYKCDFLSCILGKMLDGMTWKFFWRWNDYHSTNKNLDDGHGVAAKMSIMCNTCVIQNHKVKKTCCHYYTRQPAKRNKLKIGLNTH